MHLVIIGGGPGGNGAAIRARELGADVTVIEDRELGGTCLNRGCIPTKALLSSSRMYAKARSLDKYGIDLEGSVRPNLPAMMERKDKVVSTLQKGIVSTYKSAGIKVINAKGVLSGPGKVEVSLNDGPKESIEADRVIIATGSTPAEIPAFPFDGERVISSDHALKLTSIPKSMIIIGAGVIGSEFACIFRELGTEVTMVEFLDRPVATEDTAISALLTKEFKKMNINLLTGVGAEKAEKDNEGVTVSLSDGKELKAEMMLVAVGRAYNSEGLGLGDMGVELGQRGEIKVNHKMETSVDGVYAIGDVTGGILLAHTAHFEGLVAAGNACGNDSSMDYSSVPAAIFTTPELASVGLRDFEAKDKGIKITESIFQYRTLGKAHAMGEIAGFFKIIAEPGTGRVLGVHIAGAHAADIIHEGALALRKGLTASDIAHTIHAHPTLSEGLMEAATHLKHD